MSIDAIRATQVLHNSFERFDTAAQKDPSMQDGIIGQNDLQTVAANTDGRFSAQEVEAAQLLLDSTATRSYLDVAAGNTKVDGIIGRQDVDGAINAINGGNFEAGLLDLAAGKGSLDGYISHADTQAAATDPGIPQSLKTALQNLPPDLPLQTQLQAALALHRNANDADATKTLQDLLDSSAFHGLDESQQKQALAMFGYDSAVSHSARSKLDTVNLQDPQSLAKFLLTEARPADAYRDAMSASGVADAQRKPYTIQGPESVKHDFPSGTTPNSNDTLPALRYTVQVDGQSIEVIVPEPGKLDTDKYSYPTIEQIAKGLAAQPSASLAATDKVVVNPTTPKETNDRGEVVNSDADMYAGGDTISINPHKNDSPRDQKAFDTTFLHETAHLVDQPDRAAWNEAVQNDQLFSTHYADNRYVAEGGSSINQSLDIDPGEDFAEAYMIYHMVKGTPEEAQMRALMPERFAILDKMYP